MNRLARWAVLLSIAAVAASSAAGEAKVQIQQAINAQVQDWNRGDIPAFVTTYSDECTFVGKEVAHGRAQLLARYQKAYPDRAAMGQLAFSDLDIQLIVPGVAIVTGGWHLARSGANKNVGGLFSLVLRHEQSGWKIVLDHTS